MKDILNRMIEGLRGLSEATIRSDRFSYRLSLGFFNAVFILGVIYRIRIYYMLRVDTAFVVSQTPTLLFLNGLFNEAVFALCAALLAWIALYTIFIIRKKTFEKTGRIVSISIFALLVVLLVFIYNMSYHFWVSMNTGLTRDLLLEGAATTSLGDAVKFIDFTDMISIMVSLGALFLFAVHRKVDLWRNRVTGVILLCIVFTFSVHSVFASTNIAGGMSNPPLIYTFASFFEKDNWRNTGSSNTGPAAGNEQLRSIQFIDPRFVFADRNQRGPIQYRSNNRWNVLYIVLESTGREYVFNTSAGNKMPMPFLHELSKKSLFLDYHFGTGNTSPRSLFSMLSGLYPDPKLQMFCTKDDVTIPSLATFLGREYDSFLVTPGSLDWFFPKGFMQNSGFRELYGYDKVPARITKDQYGKDEIETVSFFIDRLRRTGDKPFLAVYYSYVAHWPYIDFGEQYRIFPGIENRLNRYYNNLYMMDAQIKRIFDYLEQAKLLDNTIVVILGDHGEAFNQHPGNWVHSRASFNENYRVPALIYQPKIFAPRTIAIPTSHADILPTLLEAMGIPYNEKLFQGESLFQSRLRRKYIFLFGNENTVTSISMNGIKVQHSFKDNRCWAFDLNRDPGERTELGCEAYREQRDTLLFYYQYQEQILNAYNDAMKRKTDFNGQRHAFRR